MKSVINQFGIFLFVLLLGMVFGWWINEFYRFGQAMKNDRVGTLDLDSVKNSLRKEHIKIAADSIISLRPSHAVPIYYDTLIDLNNDGIDELFFEYYGLSGSGEKNRIELYQYDTIENVFKINESMSELVNPSFYFENNTICSYYIANGGGSASKYRWDMGKTALIENYNIEIFSQDSMKVIFNNYVSGVCDTIIWNKISLPKEYRYGEYSQLIKEK